MLLLIAGLVALLLVSSASDTRWGRGVRGAARGVSSKDGGGLRDRVSSGRAGFTSGWKDTRPQGHRQGHPRGQRTLLQNLSGWVRGRVPSGRCPHCRRTDQQCPWCRYGEDGDTWLIREPGRPDRHEAADRSDDGTFPRVGRGAQMWLVDRRTLQSTPFSDHYSGQPWQLHDPDYEPVLRLGYTAPAVGGQDVESVHGWAPGDPTPRNADGFDVIDPKTGQVTGHLSGDDLDHMSAEAAELYPTQSADDVVAGGLRARLAHLDQFDSDPTEPIPPVTTTAPSTGGRMISGMQAGTIENLPAYKRYLSGALTASQAELDDAQTGVQRHQALAASTADGVAVLTALEVDRQTLAEGYRVTEAAQVAKEASQKLAAAVADLVDAVKAAVDGARRTDTAQEVHDAGLLAQKPAYHGA